jgi:hypothetical protein
VRKSAGEIRGEVELMKCARERWDGGVVGRSNVLVACGWWVRGVADMRTTVQ